MLSYRPSKEGGLYTLSEALAAARERTNPENQPVEIRLGEGVHWLEEMVAQDACHSHLTVRGEGRAVISGGRVVQGWEPVVIQHWWVEERRRLLDYDRDANLARFDPPAHFTQVDD
ncbi:MAG: hypothetical protein JJU29_02295 [Verrucomicrobia bacterium]|nr:hypothetical protein [Verrucomicrobiota bacterium]MCH8513253.1 hypothetical protein [Kiritimatiellia bacterium]